MHPTLTFYDHNDAELALPANASPGEFMALATATVLRQKPSIILDAYRAIVKERDELRGHVRPEDTHAS